MSSFVELLRGARENCINTNANGIARGGKSMNLCANVARNSARGPWRNRNLAQFV